MSKQERLEAINLLIKFISERGRRFFYREENQVTGKPATAFMKFRNNRLYFVDPYTNKDVFAYEGFSKQGFTHGGTLWALVCDFSYFIRTGKSSNGKHGHGGLYSGDWGHSDEIQDEIIRYAKVIGYLKK